MPRSVSIKSNLADDCKGSEANQVPSNSQVEKTSLSDDDGRVANEIFGLAIAAVGPGKLAASELGISEAHLSDMRNGNRTVADHRWVRITRKNRAAGIAIIRALAGLVGNVRVTEVKQVDKATLDKQLRLSLRRNPAALRIALADAAYELGIDEEEAAQIWDEPPSIK